MLMGWAGVRVARRVMPMLGMEVGVGACLFVPAVTFLVVVGAPPPVLVAALLLAIVLTLRAQRHESLAVPLILALAAVLLGLTGLHAPTAPYLTGLPPMAAYGAAGVLWYGLAASALFAGSSVTGFSYSVLVSLAAVACASLFLPAASSLAIDSAIIASAIGGVLLAGCAGLSIGNAARMGVGFLLAYLQVAALWQGAWIAGVASIGIWALAVGWLWMQQDTWGERYGT